MHKEYKEKYENDKHQIQEDVMWGEGEVSWIFSYICKFVF